MKTGVAESTLSRIQPLIDSTVVPKGDPLRRCMFELAALAIVLLAVVTLIVFAITGFEGGLSQIYLYLNILWPFGFILLVNGFVRLRRRAKLYSLPTLEKLDRDKRDPILYLHSFYEAQHESIWRTDLKSSEEVLVSALKDTGPVLAVAKPKAVDQPSETVFPLGSFRIYLKGEDWQASVKALMSISQLVVIDAGFSPGLETEIGIAASTINPQKLMLSFLSWDSLDDRTREVLYNSFRKVFEKGTGVSLPESLGDTAFMLFETNRTTDSIAIGLERRFIWGLLSFSLINLFGDASTLAVKRSLKPALKKRGLSFNLRQETVYVCSLALIPALLGLLVLLSTLIDVRLFHLSFERPFIVLLAPSLWAHCATYLFLIRISRPSNGPVSNS